MICKYHLTIPICVLCVVGVWVGCVRVQTEPIRIEPIYIEITVNHRVQEALDSVFAEIDQASRTTEYAPLDEEGAEK